jgi:hypothetical protein
MLVKSWRFITLILSALVTGMAFCHYQRLARRDNECSMFYKF